jgi:hypothetical protein
MEHALLCYIHHGCFGFRSVHHIFTSHDNISHIDCIQFLPRGVHLCHREARRLPSGHGSLGHSSLYALPFQVYLSTVVSLLITYLRVSVAELVSAYPTSGGIYFITKHVFPPEHVPIAAWIIGWSNFLGQ